MPFVHQFIKASLSIRGPAGIRKSKHKMHKAFLYLTLSTKIACWCMNAWWWFDSPLFDSRHHFVGCSCHVWLITCYFHHTFCTNDVSFGISIAYTLLKLKAQRLVLYPRLMSSKSITQGELIQKPDSLIYDWHAMKMIGHATTKWLQSLIMSNQVVIGVFEQ